MNSARYANPERTTVRVETDTHVLVFEMNPDLPEWQALSAKIEAGEIVIGGYEPPQPLAQD